MPARIFTCAALAAFAFAIGVPSANASTVFKGRFGCAKDNRAIAGARVELTTFKWGAMGKFPTNLQVIGTTQTDASGRWGFSVSGEETEIFARIVLSGREAEIREGLAPWNHWADTADHQNDVPEHDYGLQLMRGYECALYNGFREAELDYEAETGNRAPQGEVVARAGPPTAGVPFTFYDVVWWPSGYPTMHGSVSVPRHEFAHSFRHWFDGSDVHFYGDVAVFNYLRHHSGETCAPTNAGFAFNEGWAEFWSGDVRAPCPDANDPNIERNVAAELKAMQTRCRLTRNQMVDVLRTGRGRIHSVVDFGNLALCSRKWGRLDTNPDPAARRRLDAIKRADAARSWQRSQDAQIKKLRSALKASRRAAERSGDSSQPCVLRTCARLAERRMRPPLDAGKLEQAMVVKKQFEFLADRHRMQNLAPGQVVRTQLAGLRRSERKSASIAATAFGRAERALRGLRGVGELATLRADLRSARKAAKRRDSASLRGLSPAVRPLTTSRGGSTGDIPLVDVVIGPGSPPAAPARSPSAITIDGVCDGSRLWTPEGVDNTAKASGQLSPTSSNSPLTVTYRPFGSMGQGTPVTHLVQTDATGTWSDSITAMEWAAAEYGSEWHIEAHFDGDTTRLPADAQPCIVQGHYP